MAAHAKCCSLSHAFILIVSFTGMIPVESAQPGFSYYKTSPHAPPRPQPQGFVDQLPDLVLFQATSNNVRGDDLPNQQLADLIKAYNHDVLDGRPSQLSESKEQNSRYGGPRLSAVSFNGYGGNVKSQGDLVYTLGHLNTVSITPQLPKNNPLTPSTNKLGLSKMGYLALANNKLMGPIPPSIKEAQDTLIEVLLLNNQLSGCLPKELGMLTKAVLIDAGVNQLTGPIPSSFSCLRSVEQLNLAGNHLYGEVPDALCKLAGPTGRLNNLTLSGNYFTSVGQACAALIKDGVLDVKNNCIPGLSNQRRSAECAAFQSQPKTCPAESTQLTCPAAAAMDAAAPGERKARDYFSYVTYATLQD